MCFPVVISFGVESSLNSRILSFSPGIGSSSRNDSDAPLSTSSVTPLVLEVNRLVAAAVNMKLPSKSLLLPSKLMTGFSLSGDSLSLAAPIVSAVDLLFPKSSARSSRTQERRSPSCSAVLLLGCSTLRRCAK